MPYIELREVEKTFPVEEGEVRALDGVSLDLARGEFVSLVGPSGCGKSTLLRILGGLSRPTGGRALVEGAEVRAPRKDVAVVFQRPVLLPWRRVIDNVLLPVDVAGEPRSAHRERATELLRLVGLEGFATRYPGQLSGGMQQRVSICRALMRHPAILLMDEPFGALDAITREEMGVELLRIWSEVGATVLFITHSISEAVFLSDRVAVMSRRPGRVLEVLGVELPRPRTLALLDTPEFGRLAARIRALIGSGREDAA